MDLHRLSKGNPVDELGLAGSRLYGTTSRPFDPPETGKIAIKVVNHYEDELLEVFNLVGEPDAEPVRK